MFGQKLFGSPIIQANITNRQKHAVIAEFGSGIYNDGNGPKTLIRAKNAGSLIIPVSTKYSAKLQATTIEEARQNAIKHPDILNKLKGQMPGVFGFIFRDSIKGMHPIRMVRNSIPKVEAVFTKELTKAFSNTQSIDRLSIVSAVNRSAIVWLREIVKRSPVLTSNLRTGWTLSRVAK